MKANRRFNLYTGSALDFPVIRNGRIQDHVSRLQPTVSIFTSALECGLIHAAPKVSAFHIQFLASNQEEIATDPVMSRGLVSVSVRFDATDALEATDHEIRWRMYRAGLLGLLAISNRVAPESAACSNIKSIHASTVANSMDFPEPTDEQHDLFNQFAFYSKGKKSGHLTIELFAPPQHVGNYDFQAVFDQISSALSEAKLGSWIGDSGNDIEYRSRDLDAAQSCVQGVLDKYFDGSYRFSTFPD